MTERTSPDAAPPASGEPDAGRAMPPAAERALAEAAARRAEAAERRQPLPTEVGGRRGPEPVRYGDWEVKGIASDF